VPEVLAVFARHGFAQAAVVGRVGERTGGATARLVVG
jgi:hypothetical protein